MFFAVKRASTFSFRRHVLESFQKHCTILLSRQSNFSISCDLYSCGYCRVFLHNDTKVRGSFSVVLSVDGPARHLLFVKKESTEINCFDPNHGFIQMHAYHRRASWVRVSFAGVKAGGGGGGGCVWIQLYFWLPSVP